jgi:hypothetical protein
MALAWIIYRDMDKVRQVWPEYVNAIKYWVERVYDGRKYWTLESNTCTFDFYHSTCFVAEPETARNDFRRKILNGTIIANVINEVRRNIEPKEWIDFHFLDIADVRANIDCDIHRSTSGITVFFGPAFSRVLVSAKDVLAAYPAADEIRGNAGTLLRPVAGAPPGKHSRSTKAEAAADAL